MVQYKGYTYQNSTRYIITDTYNKSMCSYKHIRHSGYKQVNALPSTYIVDSSTCDIIRHT